MTASALTVTPPLTQLPAPSSLQEVQSYAKLFAESGLFADTRQMAQAAVRILAGSEIGIRPFASMNGLHVIKGKVTISAGLMATLIKRSGRYNYRVTEHTDAVCKISFFEHGEPCGASEFCLNDAKAPGLMSNPVWTNYPRNMLFARALSNGARWYCADIFSGPVYTPEEMGANVNAEGEVIDLPAQVPSPAAQTAEPAAVTTQESAAPKPADIARKAFEQTAAEFGIVVSDIPAENRRAWFETLLGRKPEKYTAEVWHELAGGMIAYQQETSHNPDMMDATAILSYVQRTWPDVGSLLQMSNGHWQGVCGMIEEEQMEAAHMKDMAAPLTMTTVDEDAARQTMKALTQ